MSPAGPDVALVVVLWLSALAVLTIGWFLAGGPGLVVLAVVLACSYAGPADAACRLQHGDSMDWKGDKRAHLLWSGAGALGVDAAAAVLDLPLTTTDKWLVAMAPGLLRELKTGCGSDTRGGFSWQDLVYNGIGAAAGLGVGQGVRVLLAPHSIHIYKEW